MHFRFLGSAREIQLVNALGKALCLVHGSENRLDLNLVGAENKWLHSRVHRYRLAYDRQWRERREECWYAAPVDPPPMAARTLAKQWRPGPPGNVNLVNQFAEPHKDGTDLGKAARQNSVKIGMYVLGFAVPHQMVCRRAAKVRYRFSAEPGKRAASGEAIFASTRLRSSSISRRRTGVLRVRTRDLRAKAPHQVKDRSV